MSNFQKCVCAKQQIRKYFWKHSDARKNQIASDDFLPKLSINQPTSPKNSNSNGSENVFETAVASKLKKFWFFQV